MRQHQRGNIHRWDFTAHLLPLLWPQGEGICFWMELPDWGFAASATPPGNISELLNSWELPDIKLFVHHHKRQVERGGRVGLQCGRGGKPNFHSSVTQKAKAKRLQCRGISSRYPSGVRKRPSFNSFVSNRQTKVLKDRKPLWRYEGEKKMQRSNHQAGTRKTQVQTQLSH